MNKYLKLLIAVGVCELTGLLSTPFTIASIPTWYKGLNKPFFSPPNYVFGPVWTLLYFLMGVSLFLIWEKGFKNKHAKEGRTYFIIQLILNFFWSAIFFWLHAPFAALIEIIFMWGAILFTILKFYKVSKPAAYLLIPYLAWVSFATLLNASIVLLN